MKKELLKVSIRQNALFLDETTTNINNSTILNQTTGALLMNATKLGFTFSEELLQRINTISPPDKVKILEVLKEITGVNKNWTPLMKQWDNPTGESVVDHVITFFANVFKSKNGTTLSCGHVIPENTFPLERYNGCPYCGTPFEFDSLVNYSGTGKLKVLELWSRTDLKQHLTELLQSPVALDASQVESLNALLGEFGLPKGIDIKMKETTVLVVDALVSHKREKEASALFNTPTDILRYLWYKHTGFTQIVEPKTIVKRLASNARNRQFGMDKASETKIKTKADLKLKFDRPTCKMYASWLNGLNMDIEKQCENMHSKRGIWIKVIRALRLAEYSKKRGYEKLAELLDVFYNEVYEVWQGEYEKSKMKYDEEAAFRLLKARPGLFARSLFSNMLWFGGENTVQQFKQVSSQVPARLVATLNMYAENYFEKGGHRSVKPLGGTSKRIPSNQLLEIYSDDELIHMQKLVRDLTLETLEEKYRQEGNKSKSVYIDQALYNLPLAIGDRSETVQDLPSAAMGTRFPVEGNTVRLFLQWGQGLPAQHLDMDLSCKVVYHNHNEFCSYSQLVIHGCKHSGDIQHIPNKVGTAEYIDVDIDELDSRGAKYVVFTCNAYTNGSLSPNLVVGWMNNKHPMRISNSGVAYDPGHVQHQVRVSKTVSKGLVFGLLDVQNREIIWLEMSFSGQLTQNLDLKGTEALFRKLEAKIKIGEILEIRAKAQGQQLMNTPEEAEEVFDFTWGTNAAKVANALLA